MAGVISLFVVLLIWRFCIILGQTVFAAAGLPPAAAAFEARSALVGAGYTTSESEYVVHNPAARRVAGSLILFGYFGPAAILALLGVSFIVPTGQDLTRRALVLLLLIVGLIVIDRLGVIRALGTRPARALAKRIIENGAFETWLVVGDRVIAEAVIPLDPAQAELTLAALAAPGVTVLAVEPAEQGPATFPDETQPAEPLPGERVVVFGSQRALDPLRNASR